MQDYLYFDLSGGVDYSRPNTISKSDKKIYWLDSKNVEIYKDTGIKRMNGSKAILENPINEKIISLGEYTKGNKKHLICSTDAGNFYFYDSSNNQMVLKKSNLDTGAKMHFASFSNGVICTNGVDEPFFFEIDAETEIKTCNATDANNSPIRGQAISIYKGRVWIADSSTLYYSALGKFDDWQNAGDAGYISNFHNDSSEITALKNYKDYLAIYKKDQTYLLQGTDYSDFAVVPFADKGCYSPYGCTNSQNRQYFFCEGVYSLEVSGELNQISLSSELSLNIKSDFENIDNTRLDEIIAIPYDKKDQIWFYIPYNSDPYLKTSWIYDFKSNAWIKRVSPKNITCATVFDEKIITADSSGQIYIEDLGNDFDGEAIEFEWISSYFIFNHPNFKKSIDEFFMNLDDSNENNFEFSVSKDFIKNEFDDSQSISTNYNLGLIWDIEDDGKNYNWDTDDIGNDVKWYPEVELCEKAIISGSSKGVSLKISGNSLENDFTLIGIEFRGVITEET